MGIRLGIRPVHLLVVQLVSLAVVQNAEAEEGPGDAVQGATQVTADAEVGELSPAKTEAEPTKTEAEPEAEEDTTQGAAQATVDAEVGELSPAKTEAEPTKTEAEPEAEEDTTQGAAQATVDIESGEQASAEAEAESEAEETWIPDHTPRLLNPIDLSGYFWVDSGHMERTNAREGQYDQSASYMQGRFVLGAEYLGQAYGLYALAKAELIGFVNEFTKSQFEAHVLDAYVRVGQRYWDVQIGRFLAWEVYYRGQGIELYTPEEAGALGGPSLYWLDYTRGHKNEAGQAAVHVYPWEFLGIEIAGVYGQESNQNNYGVRPAVDFKTGGLRVIGGYEYLQQSPQNDADQVEVSSQGFAGRVQYELPVVTLGVNASHSSVEYIDIQGLVDGEKTLDKTSVGGFSDIDFWRNSIGLGYHYTMQKNHQKEKNTHHVAFLSYLLRLPIDGLSVKVVYGFAIAHIQDVDADSEWDNTMQSFRLRVAYDFQ